MSKFDPPPQVDKKILPLPLQDWLRRFYLQVLGAAGSGTPWTSLNFSGSNITDIVTRNHNNLQNIQGGAANDYSHLTAVQYALFGASSIPTSSIKGTTTNDSAAAGFVGEYVSSTVVSGSSVTLTTNTTANITNISLTAGDWDVTGTVAFTFGATTSYTNLVGGVSTTSATLGSQGQAFDYETAANVPTAAADSTWVVPTSRISIASTTTVYLVTQATFTVSSLKAYGIICARRMR